VSRRSAGSVTARNGAPDPRGASASESGDSAFSRCRYKGYVGMHRWVGLGVIADNLINIGHVMEKQQVMQTFPLQIIPICA
jgi:hypothetical protein